MLKSTICLLAVAAACTVPAVAQGSKQTATDKKQCEDQFKAVDIDNNGELSSTEIGNAKPALPASLTNKDRVTRSEFMGVCGKRAS
jgi:hypothetical protein